MVCISLRLYYQSDLLLQVTRLSTKRTYWFLAWRSPREIGFQAWLNPGACRFRTVSFSFSHLCFPQYWFHFQPGPFFPSSCNLTAYQISNQVRTKTQLSEQLWQKSYSSLSVALFGWCAHFWTRGLRLAPSRSHKENRRMVPKRRWDEGINAHELTYLI